jgi:hypothetical protein
MGISGTIGALSGLGSLGLGAYGLFGGGGNAAPPQQFQFPEQSQAAFGALGGAQGLGQYNTYGNTLGQYGQIAQGLVNNPYAAGAQAGANVGGKLGMQTGLGAVNQGQNLYGAGNSVLNTAFDPQSDLYNRTLAQVQQQQNVQNANAGVGSTPYGAGLTDYNIGNFNIDWQNQQLGRQLSGLQGAGQAYGQGAQLQQGGVGSYLQGSAVPYSTYGQIGQGQLGALGQYGAYGQQAAQLPQQQIQDYLNYLQASTGQQQANTGSAQLGFNEQLGYGGLLAGGLGTLSRTPGLGWGSSYGSPGGVATTYPNPNVPGGYAPGYS